MRRIKGGDVGVQLSTFPQLLKFANTATALHYSDPTMSTIPTQQKALLLESKLGQFAVRTIDVPKLGPDSVLVKVEATALNPLDWKVQAFGLIVENYPSVLGFDAAGLVVAVGENVSSVAVGDRV